MAVIQERHKKLAFYGVPSTGIAGYTPTRMKFFTKLTTNKNPIEHNVKYVDEPTKRNAVAGYDTAIDYGFDDHAEDQVLRDIKRIHTKELTGALAERVIIVVDTYDNSATMRKYVVVPGTEGDDAEIYTYSGSFKANGEITTGTVTTSDDYETITFTADS